ncbi:MAG: PaaI family thioesterase [Novosphingobium sp.]|nr:PaaI family thioesterase [Novosphingobium sp.]
MMDAETLEAEGWERLPTHAFSLVIGSTWITGEPGNRTVGLIADPVAVNENIGIVHGGALMTFADVALGAGVADVIGHANCATAQLQFQFASAARAGSFITCNPEVVRKTSQLVFIRGLIEADSRTIGAADAIFKILEQEKMEKLRSG